MLNWKDSFIGYKSILINRNGEYESPKGKSSKCYITHIITVIHFVNTVIISFGAVLHMDPDWSYVDFLNAASNRLDLNSSAKRAFNTNGTSIFRSIVRS